MKTPVRTRLLSALLSLVMLVSLLPVSVFAAEPASGTWEKVTEAQEDWSGQYLIVYEKGSLIMDGLPVRPGQGGQQGGRDHHRRQDRW